MTFERKFFLGFLVEESYQNLLKSVNDSLLNLYTKDLQQEFFGEERYLGCYSSSPAEIPYLEQLESHIFSLLKRIIPDYPYERSSLVLFPIVKV